MRQASNTRKQGVSHTIFNPCNMQKKTAIVQSSVNGTPIKAKVHSQTRAVVVNKKTYICQAEGSGKEEHIEQLAVA